jgi:hypothetical protein
MGNNMNLANDISFETFLIADLGSLPTNVRNGHLAYAVDSKLWYIFHEGTWYEA